MVSAFLKKLMFARQFEIDNGKITILGQNLIMLPGYLIIELQEIDAHKTYQFAKFQTNKLIESYFYKIGSNFTRSDNTVCDVFNNFGLGKLQLVENNENITIVNVSDSTIARDFLKKNEGFTDKCVCHITAGVLAGMFSFLKKKDVNATEKECHAKRDEKCKFIIE